MTIKTNCALLAEPLLTTDKLVERIVLNLCSPKPVQVTDTPSRRVILLIAHLMCARRDRYPKVVNTTLSVFGFDEQQSNSLFKSARAYVRRQNSLVALNALVLNESVTSIHEDLTAVEYALQVAKVIIDDELMAANPTLNPVSLVDYNNRVVFFKD